MNKRGLFAYAVSFAPGIHQGRRTTWVAVGAGLLALFGLLIWAALALIGWLWGQPRTGRASRPMRCAPRRAGWWNKSK